MDPRLMLDLYPDDTSSPDDLTTLLASLDGFGNQGGYGSPVNLMGAMEQSPPQLPSLSQPTSNVSTQNLSQRIQEAIGGKEPDKGGMASEILSGRFNTGQGPSYGDYAQGVVQSAMGKPTLGGQIGQERGNDILKQMAAIAEIQKLSSGGEFGQLINTYQSMPDTDPRKQFYKDKIAKETTVSSLFGPIAGVDPRTNMPMFGTRADAAGGGLKPPAPAGQKYTSDGRLVPTEPSVRDQMRIQKSSEGASSAASVERLSNEAMAILKRYPTDKATKIRGQTAAWYDVFSDNPSQTEIQDYQSLARISNDLGAIGLQQFGGNDTDRELQIAISTGIDPNNVTGANMNAASRKLLAAQILQQKPIFEEEWLNRAGSLTAPDPQTSETFSRSWMGIQKQMWNDGLSKLGEGFAPEGTPPAGNVKFLGFE